MLVLLIAEPSRCVITGLSWEMITASQWSIRVHSLTSFGIAAMSLAKIECPLSEPSIRLPAYPTLVPTMTLGLDEDMAKITDSPSSSYAVFLVAS